MSLRKLSNLLRRRLTKKRVVSGTFKSEMWGRGQIGKMSKFNRGLISMEMGK